MTDFRLLRRTVYESPDGQSVTLCLSPSATSDLQRSIEARLPDGWAEVESVPVPVEQLPWGAPAQDAFWPTIHRLRADLKEAGIKGAEDLATAPGWVPILKALAPELICLQQRHAGTINVRQVKEKFGLLRVYLSVDGDDQELGDRLLDLEDWCEGQSRDRCMIYGTPGERLREPHVLTLSPDAVALRERDLKAFRRAFSPPPSPDPLRPYCVPPN
ncbi:hypothetical protein [Tranquillimonas alkanivorans]|uniref:Uncharacterized protein n=1 Tax=Tranquillimonas alkanivorans TaxID=441119 RepID=A0A1I5W2J8_9RHOB|nr:hypothetical protein [Tranquillimonas alkanivorans]SFQ13807.1 hypothetical protein SAMN04488047_1397 [Tranquillimonas alkanivorans]